MTINKALISGGGTGGHIFPALSIAAALRRRHPNVDILFVGADNRMEMQRVPDAGYPIVGLPVSGFDRRHLWRNIKVLWRLWCSMRRARRVVKDFAPDVAIGVGGYASGPTLKAAQSAGVPTVLQEQNSYAGVTNKLLAKRAGVICVAYEGMDRFFPADKIVLTGNPVRPALLQVSLTRRQAKQQLGFDPDKPLVMVVGGSLGARTINRAMEAHLTDITDAGIQLLWQTGKNYTPTRSADEMPAGAKVTRFISDMGTAYRAADIVVSRAGAGTISELQLLGKATILVPSPNVAEDHQRKNALALADRNAAIMILDSDADTALAPAILKLIADSDTIATLESNISAMALNEADEKIVDEIERLLSHHNNH